MTDLNIYREAAAVLSDTDVDVVYLLNNTNPEAKEEFLENDSLIRPHNIFSRLHLPLLRKNLDILLQFKSNFEWNRIEEKWALLLQYIADQNIRKNKFLLSNLNVNTKAGAQLDFSSDEAEHKSLNAMLYGEVQPDVFWSILENKLNKIDVFLLSSDEKRKYEELMDMLGPCDPGGALCDYPSQEVFSFFSHLINAYYSDIVSCFPSEDKMYSVYEVCELTNTIIERFCPGYGWSAEVDPNRVAAATRYEDKRIYYPGKRTRGDYSRDELMAVIIHEFGVHVMRSIAYDECELTALASGLPGYIAFEEGVAKAVEQSIIGKFSPSGELHYVSIGLATLLKKSFREVFEIQTRLEGLIGGASPSQCFDSVQRAFRGTGILVNSKDLAYHDGSALVWKLIREKQSSPELLLQDLFLSGKSDPTNPFHKRVIYELRVNGYAQQVSDTSMGY